MKRVFILIVIFSLTQQLNASERYGEIKLLEGYSIKKGWAVDAAAWTIHGQNGLRIEFEAGMNEGLWANPKDRSKYAWYREQIINGHKVHLALIKPGLKTVWEPDHPRSQEPGDILLITFPLGIQADNTANFKAEILNEQELADALLMVLTFNPEKY